MINSELINYVKQSLQQNIGEQDIRGTLLAAGWAQTDVNDAVNTVKSLEAVNASAGIISNYSGNGNGKAALQNSGQTMQEPIIGIVKGLESGASQFWSSSPKHYAAIFTPERIIFINIKNSAASSVFNGLVGGMVGSMVSSLDEQYKTEELINEIGSKGVDNILREYSDALVLSKDDLAGAAYKEGSRLWRYKSKISLNIGGAARNFYAPAGDFQQFQSLASNLLSGNFQPVQFAAAGNLSAMPNALNADANDSGSGRRKTIAMVFGIIFILLSGMHFLGGLSLLGENITDAISLFISGIFNLALGILILKMKRWGLYLAILAAAGSVLGISDLAEAEIDTPSMIFFVIDLIVSVGSAGYLWSIRRVLK